MAISQNMVIVNVLFILVTLQGTAAVRQKSVTQNFGIFG